MAAKHQLDLKHMMKNIFVMSLLMLYSAASLRIDSLHQFFHADDVAELHSAEHENNPCHKNIYHQQREAGCDHQSHLTENTKCPLCEFNISSDELLFVPDQIKITFQRAINQSSYQEGALSLSIFILSGRGPPHYI
jgi:hypothetical protein